jgi:hypothetical protein
MLWLQGWTRTGIPDDECARFNGVPAYADPTNDKYRLRVTKMIHRLLGSGRDGYNADGLKFDGVSSAPYGPSLETAGRLAGFELMRALLKLFHDEVKAAKADGALSQYTAFPYFADTCDFVRTGDLYTVKGDPNSANAFRAGMMRAVMPEIAIDTDGAERFNYVLPFGASLKIQKQFGVPCLYQAEELLQRRDFCLPVSQKLQAAHYRTIRKLLQSS